MLPPQSHYFMSFFVTALLLMTIIICQRELTGIYFKHLASNFTLELPAISMANQLLSVVPHHVSLPDNYVRPEPQRPRLDEVIADTSVPTIDLNSPDIIDKVADACTSHGCFQVVNHGVESVPEMLEMSSEFFQLPAEEKAKHYSDDPMKKMRLSTSSNVRTETVRNWRDYLRLHCYPLEEFVPSWPSNPPSFKRVVSTYCREVRQVGMRLLRVISLSLELEEEYLVKVLGEPEQHMAINYYPRCPEPELTYGLPPHTDPNAFTILLQDPSIPGLQVLKDGHWIAVNPQHNALVINIGDQLQALSNGRYKSAWHRAIVNSYKERISVASFVCPCRSVVINPPEKLITNGSPAVYKSYTYDEYYTKFWSRNLDDEHCLELFKK